MQKGLKNLFRGNYLFTAGCVICLFWVVMAVFAHIIAPYDPIAQNLSVKLQAPSAAHLFGTDNFGRDIFSRVIYGGRYSLMAGILTVLIAMAIGSVYGAAAGYIGGAVDNVMMRISEMILSFPSLILAMCINAALGSNLFNTMFALIIVAWPSYARLMRSVVLTVKENQYIEAAEALGASRMRILLHWLRAADAGMGHDGFGRSQLFQQILGGRVPGTRNLYDGGWRELYRRRSA